jgi:hypothetical protein
MSGIYGVLDQAIAFEKKLQKDEHDRLMARKEDVKMNFLQHYQGRNLQSLF